MSTLSAAVAVPAKRGSASASPPPRTVRRVSASGFIMVFSPARLRNGDVSRYPSPSLPGAALCAFAALGLEEQVEIFVAIVEGDLVARADRLNGAQHDLARDQYGFRIRPARMIGIARGVAACRAVN